MTLPWNTRKDMTSEARAEAFTDRILDELFLPDRWRPRVFDLVHELLSRAHDASHQAGHTQGSSEGIEEAAEVVSEIEATARARTERLYESGDEDGGEVYEAFAECLSNTAKRVRSLLGSDTGEPPHEGEA